MQHCFSLVSGHLLIFACRHSIESVSKQKRLCKIVLVSEKEIDVDDLSDEFQSDSSNVRTRNCCLILSFCCYGQSRYWQINRQSVSVIIFCRSFADCFLSVV